MTIHRNPSAGSTILGSLLLVIILFGLTSAIAILADARSRGLREDLRQASALAAAEGGLEIAKWEIELGEDPEGDGVGNVTRNLESGEVVVTAVELAPNRLELSATGTTEGTQIHLEEVVEVGTTTSFPYGALSIVGGTEHLRVKFKNHLGLSIDGGVTAGINVTDPDLYAAFVEEVATAIEAGRIEEDSISGSLLGGEGDLSIINGPSLVGPENFQQFYDTAVAAAEVLLAGAEPQGLITGSGLDEITYGTAEAPVVVHLDDTVHLQQADVISGYGTLIISDEFRLSGSSSLDWHGDVIVIGTEGTHPHVELQHSSTMNIDGSLTILGEGNHRAEIRTQAGTQVSVDGAVTIATQYEEDQGEEILLSIDGGFDVDGLMSVLGSKVDAKFHNDSDFDLDGMLQIALLNDDERLGLEFNGQVDIAFDLDQVNAGAATLEGWGAPMELPGLDTFINTGAVRTLSWRKVFP